MFRHFANTRLLVAIVAALTLAACGGAPAKKEAASAELADSVSEGQTLPVAPTEPPEAIAAFERAMQQMSAGDLAGAERAFIEISQAYPTYAGPLINLAILQAKAGRTDEAERSLQEAVSRNPNSAPAHNQLGILYRKLGRFKDAGESYERAVQSDPNYPLAHLNMGVLCDLYLGQPERALQSFERYLELEGNPQPQVQGWVKELRSRLGQRGPAAESQPAEAADAAAETGV